MLLIQYIFWICLALIFYNYVGYGLLAATLVVMKRIFKGKNSMEAISDEDWPAVTLVVAAYNEEDIIEAKVKNSLQLDYPKEKLSLLFVTNGSSDRTPQILSAYPDVRLLHSPERFGKTDALNRAMQKVNTPITVFCDANTMLNKPALKKLVTHYQDPNTGGVAGEKRIYAENSQETAGIGEGLYWKYESLLKRLDAHIYTVVGAAGELFSIRTSLWEPVESDIILDDFVISLRINLKGYRMAYEPDAYAMEMPSASLKDEKKRKVRISAGAFQALGLLKPVFNVFKYPVLFFQFFSHRLLRWTIIPASLPLLFITNAILAFFQDPVFYDLLFLGQVLFYTLAVVGISTNGEKGKMYKLAKICYYIVFMNYAVYLGFIRFYKREQTVIWERAEREVAV